MTLLALHSVRKTFGGVTAVSDVSFDVDEGEIVGLMGANGAGKTTLFAMIAGTIPPTSGRIELAGRRIDGMKADRVNALGIARTFQIVRTFSGMTVLENATIAAMFGSGRERSPAKARDRAHAILEDVDLAARADAPAGSVTLAERKRLEVARALATKPRVLLLDEVLAGLTATEVGAALDMLRAVKERHGLTIIIVEHVMKALMRLSDRIVVLHHGEKITEGDPTTVAADPRVQAAYFGGAHDPAA